MNITNIKIHDYAYIHIYVYIHICIYKKLVQDDSEYAVNLSVVI